MPELNTSIFVIPREHVKNGRDRYVVLNRIASAVIQGCRGKHPEFVFTLDGHKVTKICNSGWKATRLDQPSRQVLLSDAYFPSQLRRIYRIPAGQSLDPSSV